MDFSPLQIFDCIFNVTGVSPACVIRPVYSEDSDCALTVNEDSNMVLQELFHVSMFCLEDRAFFLTGLFTWILSLPSARKITKAALPGYM